MTVQMKYRFAISGKYVIVNKFSIHDYFQKYDSNIYFSSKLHPNQ